MVRALVVGLAIVMGGASAAGAEGFVWEAPDACPDARDVRLRIEHRLGMPIDGSVHGIEVAIARGANGFVARIDARGVTVADGVRTLTSAKCDDLADAVAVIVARLAREAREVKEAGAPAARAVDFAPPPPRRTPEFGGGVRMLGVSGVGIVPGIGIGGEVSAHVRRRARFAEVGVASWATSSSYLVEGAPGRVDVDLLSYAVRAGWSPQDKPLRGWLGAEYGTMGGRGVALVATQNGSARWMTANAGFSVAWQMSSHARLVGTFEVGVPIDRVRFVLAQGREIYRPSPAVARTAFGIEVGWP
ncbi:MAG: hypothetical protein KF773_09335 [Deltaproteobacteria bacterium]|nr:hypothetical protein [Deltaproteobacteria bacterium]